MNGWGIKKGRTVVGFRCSAVSVFHIDESKIPQKVKDKVRLHDLRHTFISLCLNGGVNQFQVSANCGHTFSGKGNSITVSVYWHDDNNREDIIAFIDKMITAKLEILDMSEY